MNAIQFIKDHTIEKAREVVEGAPTRANWYQVQGKYSNDLYSCNHELYGEAIMLSDLKRLVESVDFINKFDSVQEAKDAIRNAPDGATDYRKLSCTIRYIKQSERFFEYWDRSIWCRPTVPFTEETHILRFTELSRLEKAIADYEAIYKCTYCNGFGEVGCQFEGTFTCPDCNGDRYVGGEHV